jgi:GDP-L-fucose synthase
MGRPPQYVFFAAAKVGGILANESYPAEFLQDNLVIQTNIIDAAYRSGARKLLFLGSSCIYPKHAPQPIREDRRAENVSGLSSPVRLQRHFRDAD